MEDTKLLVSGAASTPDKLAQAAQSSAATITQLAEVVKLGAASLGSDDPETQVRSGRASWSHRHCAPGLRRKQRQNRNFGCGQHVHGCICGLGTGRKQSSRQDSGMDCGVAVAMEISQKI